MRPKLVDLYCCAGGASMGYHRAGFDVVGYDNEPHPNYPFEFRLKNVLDLSAEELLSEFDVIHASPPCKVHTSLKGLASPSHENLIPQTRELLVATDLPYIIENVPGAPLIDPVRLCGSSFGLGVQRHRDFESNFPLEGRPCQHARQRASSPIYPVKRYHTGTPTITMSPVVGVFGRGQGLGPGEVELWRKAMEINWTNRDELAQAIPPAYTEYLGSQMMAYLKEKRL